MADPDQVHDDLSYDFESRSNPYFQDQAWSMTVEQLESIQAQSDSHRNTTPLQIDGTRSQETTMVGDAMMDHWQYQQMHRQQHPHRHQHQHQHQHQQRHQYAAPAHAQIEFEAAQHNLAMSTFNPYQTMAMSSQMSMVPVTQAALTTNLPLDPNYMQMPAGIDGMPQNWSELQSELISYTTTDIGVAAVSPYQNLTSSPTGSHLEVLSQPSSSDDAGWTIVDPRVSFESADRQYYVDPTQTLHDRSLSESSYSDHEQQVFMSNLEMGPTQTVYSPTTYSDDDYDFPLPCHGHSTAVDGFAIPLAGPAAATTTLIRPVAIPPPCSSKSSSPDRSPTSSGAAGSPGRRMTKKSPIAAKGTDRITKKTATGARYDSSEKKVGKRKGPLKPEQRKQASEIRKLRACLRCKFLKKTCDKGEPCAGCQPSHARLWQVPCTRIDIKEIGYFLKDRRFDYERHVSLGFSIGNIKGFSDVEDTLFITHGYGHMLPVRAREVYVRDEQCLKMDWIEANRDPNGYEVSTAKLSAGTEGISTTMLSDYLDRHIDGNGTFEKFVDDYFEGTPFLSQMLKVAYRFYYRTNSRVIKKALKLMLAYNLTLHITMVEGIPSEQGFIGKIEDETSRFYGKTMAPVMINFQVKCAMADMWRELHKDVLEELSALYSSVYSGDKLKNWPTIFILASVLLAVWECMQFDCHYRVPDEAAVDKFCSDMETTPVGVIVGLFAAISQKLPSILEWDTSKHHTLLGSNADVCDTMSEVRDHAMQYETYLRERPNAKFDSNDFDSLSNKFLSRLVLRDIRAT